MRKICYLCKVKLMLHSTKHKSRRMKHTFQSMKYKFRSMGYKFYQDVWSVLSGEKGNFT